MANRLAAETSPYLQQHADNPVDWYPWGAEALEKAKREGKPILLSVGYSACHWCHVMAHESFEDDATARLMNELFVNIKVDREERPDIDRIYQAAQQLITQRNGGWPLTMFLTHEDQRPFFGGTYFPNEPRHGMPAFGEILKRVSEYYTGHQQELREQNEGLIRAFDDMLPPAPPAGLELTDSPLRADRQALSKNFDSNYGGFSSAPKFPHPKSIERLLRAWHATAASDQPDLQALYMATLTLTRMGEGGMYDQLGGGFCRYSVDSHWMIPHFEKMLYDNAGLIPVYAEAAIGTGDMFYATIAAETAEWVIRDMQSPEGGYYSSLDADSEGHEGKFYAWDKDEVRKMLTDEQWSLFAPRYGLDRGPNFEGKWHLHTFRTVEQVASETGIEVATAIRALNAARVKLLDLREGRVWPGRDEKILTSWNAMMIRAMAIIARLFGREEFVDSATQALDFIRRTLWRDGRLLATYKDGRAHLNAYLDDYVYLVDAILELQQVRFRADELAFAKQLLDIALDHFEDQKNGGFFFTSDDHESLIYRTKSLSDDAIPSGNGIAAFALVRMGQLLGEPRYLQAAERALRSAWLMLEKFPNAHSSLLEALDETLHPPQIIILRGTNKEIREWQRELARVYGPHRIVIGVPSDAKDLPPALADKKPVGDIVAYLCKGSVCSAPLDTFSALVEQLRLH